MDISAISSAIRRKSAVSVQLGHLISARARIGWTTVGHNGADVMLFAYGPERPTGLVENTAIGEGIAKYLGIDFQQLQRRLFVDAAPVLSERGYVVTLDRSDPTNGQLIVTKGDLRVRLPWAKNILVADQQTVTLEGLVIYANKLGRVFVPQQAVNWILREAP